MSAGCFCNENYSKSRVAKILDFLTAAAAAAARLSFRKMTTVTNCNKRATLVQRPEAKSSEFCERLPLLPLRPTTLQVTYTYSYVRSKIVILICDFLPKRSSNRRQRSCTPAETSISLGVAAGVLPAAQRTPINELSLLCM